MQLDDYEVLTYRKFMGLFARGLGDSCPPTHSPNCENVIFHSENEFQTRGGSALSLAFNHNVLRFFLSTIDDNLVPITLATGGALYKGTDTSPMITIAGMHDFVGLNMFNKTYILPCITSGSANLLVWDGTNAIRDALGVRPTSSMAAADGAAGHTDIGVHLFAVSYVTNTGFTTKPSSAFVTYTAPGSKKVNLSSIPTGPTGTVARVIIGTKSNLQDYFFVPGGTINDNTATTLTVDFFDIDLTVSADYLFDLLENMPAANSAGAIDKFHGRMIVVNTQEDLVRVSRPGEPEAFDNVLGFIQLPSEKDGNAALGTFQLRDVLYFTKSVGIYSTSDNLGDPTSWPIFPIDGGCGGVSYGISSITGAQGHLTANDIALIADLDGLFSFNGTVNRPPLTYFIDDLWKTYVNITTIQQVTVFIDPFRELFFVSVVGMGFLLVGDFSQGLTYDKIQWTRWVFPNNVQTISMATLADDEFAYRLRISFVGNNNLYKYMPDATNDFGTAIASKYRFSPSIFGEGAINIYRYLRFRLLKSTSGGTISVAITLYPEDQATSVTVPPLVVAPGPGQNFARQINFSGESMFLELSTTSAGFRVQRAQVYGKVHFGARPG